MPPPPTPTTALSTPGSPSENTPTTNSNYPPTAATASASHTTPTAGSPSQSRHRAPPPVYAGGSERHKRDEEARRSLQARGKNYNVIPGASSSSSGGSAGLGGVGVGSSKVLEYEERQRRDEAASILESEEMIMWIAAARNESIPQTRTYYRNILLGLSHYAAPKTAWLDEWETVGRSSRDAAGRSDDGRSMGSPGRGKGKEKERARKRVSLGQGQ